MRLGARFRYASAMIEARGRRLISCAGEKDCHMPRLSAPPHFDERRYHELADEAERLGARMSEMVGRHTRVSSLVPSVDLRAPFLSRSGRLSVGDSRHTPSAPAMRWRARAAF